METVLTLEIPRAGDHFFSVAMTSDPHVLLAFKNAVLRDYAMRIERAKTDGEMMVLVSQFEHMRRVLDNLIPDEDDDGKEAADNRG